MPRKIIIIGGPRTGKSTLSERLQAELGIETLHNSADLESLFPVHRPESWSQQSEHASKWFDEDGDWICEGVQMARALRKWLKANPDKPLDADLFLLKQPMVVQRDGQKAMMKGVESVFREIEGELIRRGARVQKLKDPKFAIETLLAREGQDDTKEAGSLQMPKFTIKAKVDKLDDVQERYRSAYVEREGAFHLDLAKLEGIEFDDPVELGGALDKERKSRAQLEKDLKAERDKYKDIDPAKYAELVAKAEEAEHNELKSKGKVDEMLDNQRQKYERLLAEEKQKHATEVSALNTELDRVTIDTAFRTAYEKAGVIPDRIDDAVALTRAQAKREDGKLALYDTDGLKLDISLDTFAKEVLKNARPYLYQASSNGGSGAQNGTHGGNGGKVIKRSEWEKMAPHQQSTVMAEVRAGKAEITD